MTLNEIPLRSNRLHFPLMAMRTTFAAIFLVMIKDVSGKELPKGFSLYCKEQNCYDVLGVSPSAAVADIRKAYRKLSLIHHPDKSNAPDSTEKFMDIATAYEILSSDELRKAYDDFLAHPERHVWQHYSNYYQAYYAPKSDVRLVVLGILAVVTIMQYASASFKRNRAIRVVLDQNKTKLFIKQRVYEMGGKGLNLKKKEDYAAYLKLEVVHVDKRLIKGGREADMNGAGSC